MYRLTQNTTLMRAKFILESILPAIRRKVIGRPRRAEWDVMPGAGERTLGNIGSFGHLNSQARYHAPLQQIF